jgi:hypothetical protein
MLRSVPGTANSSPTIFVLGGRRSEVRGLNRPDSIAAPPKFRCEKFRSNSAKVRASRFSERNGSGKSTLRQVICGTLVRIRGETKSKVRQRSSPDGVVQRNQERSLITFFRIKRWGYLRSSNARLPCEKGAPDIAIRDRLGQMFHGKHNIRCTLRRRL